MVHLWTKSDVDHLETGWNPLAFHGSRQTVMRTILSVAFVQYMWREAAETGQKSELEPCIWSIFIQNHSVSVVEGAETKQCGFELYNDSLHFLISCKARVTAVKNDFSNEIQVISVCCYISKLTPKGPKGLARRTVHFFREWVQLPGPNEFETQLALLTSQSRDQLLPTSLRRLISLISLIHAETNFK